MKRFLFILISSCAVINTYAQEEIFSDSIPAIHRAVDGPMPEIKIPSNFNDSFSTDEINLIDRSMFLQPLLPDYSGNLDFLKHINTPGLTTNSVFTTGIISPFLTYGNVFNQAIYKATNRFSFGGNSFGAQSIFDQPKLNTSIQDMSIKGASMFIQYKVSDKFKIQTRVSITNHSSPFDR